MSVQTRSAFAILAVTAALVLGWVVRREQRPPSATPIPQTPIESRGEAERFMAAPTGGLPSADRTPSPSLPVRPALEPPHSPDTATEQDSPELTAALRDALQSDPDRAVRVGRWAEDHYPHSVDAAERAAIVVKALMRMGRANDAKAEAEIMVHRYAGSEWAFDVKRHMLDVPSIDVPAAASGAAQR